MKKLLLSILIGSAALKTVIAQTDTLRNFDRSVPIYAPKYEGKGQYGYMLGQNHLYRQQFAEKYNIPGQTKVHGIVVHLAGVYASRTNFVEFNVYSVSPVNKLPDKKLASAQILYPDLDLNGHAYYVELPVPVVVTDSFFVTFNVQDYMHGGYDGDTLGLYCAVPGTRPKEDLVHFGRNAIQAHNHSKEDWKDFYTQNFTQVATHFALFPVVDRLVTFLHGEPEFTDGLKIHPPYPNPAESDFRISYELSVAASVYVSLMDNTGQKLLDVPLGIQSQGIHSYEFMDLNLKAGIYTVFIKTGNASSIQKVFVK